MNDFLINNAGGVGLFLVGFIINLVVVFIIVRCFYFPKSQRRDYFFTYMLMSISIFLSSTTSNLKQALLSVSLPSSASYDTGRTPCPSAK